MKVKDFIKLIESEGFVFVSQKGSHRKFRKQGYPNLIVSGKLSDDMKKGQELDLLRKANLK